MLNACRTTRIYCRDDCPPGRRTLPQNRLRFGSRAEAEAAGYRACKVCKPDVYEGPWTPKQRPAPRVARLGVRDRGFDTAGGHERGGHVDV
jgi:methylphosphotriester-DNA--protein-cysteine methyltransferase